MSLQVLAAVLGFIAGQSVTTPLYHNDIIRPRIQGVTQGDEFQIGLELFGDVRIVLRRSDTPEESYYEGKDILSLVIKTTGEVILTDGRNSTTKKLPLASNCLVTLRTWVNDFCILIDDYEIHKVERSVGSMISYIRVVGAFALTKFGDNPRIQIKQNFAEVGLKIGETLNLGYVIPVAKLALLDHFDNQNLYLSLSGIYLNTSRNIEGNYTDHTHDTCAPSNRVLLSLSVKPEWLEVYVNKKLITWQNHSESIANTAYKRLFLPEVSWIYYLKNITITKDDV